MKVSSLSLSKIRMYQRCPRQFAFTYGEGRRQPPGAHLIKGSAIDGAANTNFAQKIESHTDLPVEQFKELAEVALLDEVDQAGGRDEIQWGDVDPGAVLDSAVSLAELHARDHAPLIQPVEVQLDITRPLPNDIPFRMVLDVVRETETGVRPGDIKTGSKKMSEHEARNDAQPTWYEWGLEGMGKFDNLEPFEFFRLIATSKNTYSETVEAPRTAADKAHVVEGAIEVAVGIQNNVFPPTNPANWWCSPRWCGFFVDCRLKGQKPQIRDFLLEDERGSDSHDIEI